MRRYLAVAAAGVFLLGVLAGCKSSDQASNSADDKSGSTGAKGGGAKKSAEPVARTVAVPEGTAILVVLDQSLSTKTAQAGQHFDASVSEPVEIEGKVVIPKGARAQGIVRDAKAAGRFKGGAVLDLALTSVTVNGAAHEIATSAPTMTSTGKGKRTAGMVGGGAAAGAVIGAIAGGGKGAAIGAAAGAGAGTAGSAFTGNRDITLPAETGLTFKLTKALHLKEKQ
jgi:hypothetical protein